MTVAELMRELRQRGVELTAGGGLVRYRARRGHLSPDLREALRSQKPGLLDLLQARGPDRGWGIRLYSRVLGDEVWLVEDDPDGFAAELRQEGDARPVFTVAEVVVIETMLESDVREALRALAATKRVFAGTTLGSFNRWSGDA